MRHALLLFSCLAASGCCWDGGSEAPYHNVTVQNHSAQAVTIRYGGVFVWDEDKGDVSPVDRQETINAGRGSAIRVWRDSTVEIKAEANHVIHFYRAKADSDCSCSLSITMEDADFVPVMPVANG